MNLILASSSPYRKTLLKRLGLPFQVIPPAVDESELKQAISEPQQLAVSLAQAKAQVVAEDHTDALVIGADQLAVIENEILDKPENRERNISQLTKLSGQSHQLLTAICLIHQKTERLLLDRTFLRMRPLTTAEIEAYIDLDEPFDCAGGYQYEAHGVSLFEDVRSTDTTAIEGLPLLLVAKTLREFGLKFPQNQSN
jgi:septum formation protein